MKQFPAQWETLTQRNKAKIDRGRHQYPLLASLYICMGVTPTHSHVCNTHETHTYHNTNTHINELIFIKNKVNSAISWCADVQCPRKMKQWLLWGKRCDTKENLRTMLSKWHQQSMTNNQTSKEVVYLLWPTGRAKKGGGGADGGRLGPSHLVFLTTGWVQTGLQAMRNYQKAY